ncbi:GNAT family N-acetyltransferase [Aestuariibius insulae]|uniref:GNAT family N-acetyltransferase n=1 Tax=Aestuariibius insulae TaxID=2058287 RepID=UPI00345E10D6
MTDSKRVPDLPPAPVLHCGIRVAPLTMDDHAALLDFEQRNADFFAKWVGPRPDGYLTEAGLTKAITSLLDEAARGQGWFGLVHDGPRIVGRVNLPMTLPRLPKLGYRICRSRTGRGLARHAARQAVALAETEMQIDTVLARALPGNDASRAVLLALGFTPLTRDIADFPAEGRTCFEATPATIARSEAP